MTRSATRDLLAGLFVVIGLAAVAWMALRIGESPFADRGGLPLYATFDEISGLKPRAPVELAGVRVGRVLGIELDEDYRARVALELDDRLEIPIDTSASIVTGGLLGDRYISLQLGGEMETLQPGEEIAFTESAVIFERLIGKVVDNLGASD